MVPRDRARFSLPGREEGEALRTLWLCCLEMRCERFGGGVGTKVDPGAGRKADGPLYMELPDRYLQYKESKQVHH